MKALLLLPLLLLIGCPSGTNQQKAANAAKNVAVFVQQAQAAEISTFNNGQACLLSSANKQACVVIPVDEHVFVQEQFKAIFESDKALDSCIRTAHNAAGIVACADNAVKTVEALESQGVLHLKSDKAQATFNSVTSAVKLGIETISTILGGNS